MLRKLINLLSSKPQEAPSGLTDFSDMVVDMHSHLIPGIDDGIKTTDAAIQVLERMSRWGFKKVITTPHVIADGFNNSTETILRGRDEIRAAIVAKDISIEFDAAAEYYLDVTLNERVERGDILTLKDNYVLTEISYYTKPNNMYELVFKMQQAGYKVILAHPERYPYYYAEDLLHYTALKDRNVFFQINLMSLIGKYGQHAKAVAEELIDNNMVEFVGTDLHGRRHLALMEHCLDSKYLRKILNYPGLLNKTLL